MPDLAALSTHLRVALLHLRPIPASIIQLFYGIDRPRAPVTDIAASFAQTENRIYQMKRLAMMRLIRYPPRPLPALGDDDPFLTAIFGPLVQDTDQPPLPPLDRAMLAPFLRDLCDTLLASHACLLPHVSPLDLDWLAYWSRSPHHPFGLRLCCRVLRRPYTKIFADWDTRLRGNAATDDRHARSTLKSLIWRLEDPLVLPSHPRSARS